MTVREGTCVSVVGPASGVEEVDTATEVDETANEVEEIADELK